MSLLRDFVSGRIKICDWTVLSLILQLSLFTYNDVIKDRHHACVIHTNRAQYPVYLYLLSDSQKPQCQYAFLGLDGGFTWSICDSFGIAL